MVKSLLLKFENLSLNPQHPHKKLDVVIQVLGRQRQEDPRDVLCWP